jgi:hypothetical protein
MIPHDSRIMATWQMRLKTSAGADDRAFIVGHAPQLR